MPFWNVFWLIVMSFAFIAYLVVLFSIITDLFRDHETSGLVKVLWLFFLFVLPWLTALAYLAFRSGGMAARSRAAAVQYKDAQDRYIREAAGTSPAAQIADAKRLLDAGTITDDEFQTLKATALARG